MNGYMLAMFVIGVFGILMCMVPMYDRPKWLYKVAVAWAVIWIGPPLVIVWINGVFG